jgi:3-oxoacyl-[acyl-carrier protein] reductase
VGYAFNIRVNAVAPGVIETDIVDSLPENLKRRFLENIPLKSFGAPEEVANVVNFLASHEAGYITGEVVCVTGGLY